MLNSAGEMRPLEELEAEIIRFAIAHYRGQMSEVARRLKIGRSTLYRKLDEAANDDSAEATKRAEAAPTAAIRVGKRSELPAVPEHSNRGLAVTDKGSKQRGKSAQSAAKRCLEVSLS